MIAITFLVCVSALAAVVRRPRVLSAMGRNQRRGAAAGVVAATVAMLAAASAATAAVVPAVGLGTASNYAVLGAAGVTNTGPSVLAASLGVWPGTSITGFPPGLVLPPGTTDNSNAAAQQAQADLNVAYVDAAGRSIDATTPADLTNQNLMGGVYAGPNKGALALSGPLVLDGAGDPSSVFIFQTDSSLITASNSTVSVINGAQECNVFWQVGSSATLGTGSEFVGNVLANTSVTVGTAATVHGRVLAANGAVTLDTNTFVTPTCAVTPSTTTTTVLGSSTTTAAPGSTTTSAPGSTTTSAPASTTTTVVSTTTTNPGSTTTSSQPASTTTSIPGTTTTTVAPATTTTTTGPASTTTTAPSSSTTTSTSPTSSSTSTSSTPASSTSTSSTPASSTSTTSMSTTSTVVDQNSPGVPDLFQQQLPAPPTSTTADSSTTTTSPGTATSTSRTPTSPTTPTSRVTTSVGQPRLPATGGAIALEVGVALAALICGAAAMLAGKRRGSA